MTGDIRKVAFAAVLGAFFLATSQDARLQQPAGAGVRDAEGPVCSEAPAPDALQRMKAIQSLRETQVEVEMMRRQQSATAAKGE